MLLKGVNLPVLKYALQHVIKLRDLSSILISNECDFMLKIYICKKGLIKPFQFLSQIFILIEKTRMLRRGLYVMPLSSLPLI